MKRHLSILILLFFVFFGCKTKTDDASDPTEIPKVIVTGQMKDVMWKGELFGKIKLDSLSKKGLYGLGPESYLTGEVLIANGDAYVSKVLTDSTILVVKTDNIEAPFFVHSNVDEWDAQKLTDSTSSISEIEKYIANLTKNIQVPFAFKLEGHIESADIHIQNLPFGIEVSSPKEAHQGQVNYTLHNEEVLIIGFYSKNHKGIFTHHDTNLHMHLITKDKSKMGHLDAIGANSLTLYLPKSMSTLTKN